MKISMRTVNGKWYVSHGERTIAFENSGDALYFIGVCKKAVGK